MNWRLVLSLLFFIPVTSFIVALRFQTNAPLAWILGALLGVVIGLAVGGVKSEWIDLFNPLKKDPPK